MKETKFKQTEIGKIPEDWKIVRLGNISLKIGSGLTPRGGKKVYKNSGIALIRSQNIYNDGFKKNGLVFIDKEHSKDLDNVVVEDGDVLLNITGDSVARCCIVPSEILPARVNQHVSIIRPDPNIVNPLFLRYYLITQKMQKYMLSLADSGGTRKALTKGMIEDFVIPKPDPEEQKSIDSILSSLDDKIELNQRMNKTLEAIAQAIFKHWFVDFEFPRTLLEKGFTEKGDNQGYKSSGGEMVYNEELGKEIPKGWEIHSLSDIAQVVDCLHSKKPSQQKTGHILLQVYNIGESGELDLSQPYYIDDKDYALWTSRIKIRGGDIIISKTGRVGALAQIPKGFEGAIGRNLVCIRCLNNRIGNGYLKEYMLSPLMKKEISIRTLTGTVLQSLHVKEIEKLRVLIPSQEIASKFEKIASPIHDKINKNIAESLELSQIRDTLLPKLMSGEIRVKVDEVENEVRDETVG